MDISIFELFIAITLFTVSVFFNKTIQNGVLIIMSGVLFYYMYIERQSQNDIRTRATYVVSLSLFLFTIYNLISDFFYKKNHPKKND